MRALSTNGNQQNLEGIQGTVKTSQFMKLLLALDMHQTVLSHWCLLIQITSNQNTLRISRAGIRTQQSQQSPKRLLKCLCLSLERQPTERSTPPRPLGLQLRGVPHLQIVMRQNLMGQQQTERAFRLIQIHGLANPWPLVSSYWPQPRLMDRPLTRRISNPTMWKATTRRLQTMHHTHTAPRGTWRLSSVRCTPRSHSMFARR